MCAGLAHSISRSWCGVINSPATTLTVVIKPPRGTLSQRRGPLPKLLWADLLDSEHRLQILQQLQSTLMSLTIPYPTRWCRQHRPQTVIANDVIVILCRSICIHVLCVTFLWTCVVWAKWNGNKSEISESSEKYVSRLAEFSQRSGSVTDVQWVETTGGYKLQVDACCIMNANRRHSPVVTATIATQRTPLYLSDASHCNQVTYTHVDADRYTGAFMRLLDLLS